MTWTSHGYHIDGTVKTGTAPDSTARCGGPGLCLSCSSDASYALREISKEIVDVPASSFASADLRVINADGNNYYRSCGVNVYEPEEGGNTTCVKPFGHSHFKHEDWDGRQSSRYGSLVEDIDFQMRQEAKDVMSRTGLDDSEVFNALNALLYAGISLRKDG